MGRIRNLRDLAPGERVLLVGRRHGLVLFRSELPAVCLFLLLCALGGGARALRSPALLMAVGAALVLVVLWLLWCWASWRADRLIITDRRVLWLERTPLIRERRWEAPLEKLENVTAICRGPVRRCLGCADLVLDTASRGAETLRGMRRAHELAGGVLEARQYATRRSSRLRRLRTEMGVYAESKPEPVEETGARVWRRHRWVLVRSCLRPVGLLALGGAASGATG
ncbi:MAG: PH domain-containing protein, partial [Chloroflexota bacterium]|nr:PH domain-containing protein [Chloroflexota bacterium]